MIKYKDLNYKSVSELQSGSYPKSTEKISTKKAIDELNGVSLSSLTEMMYLTPTESSFFNCISNNQQHITKDYLKNSLLFSKCDSPHNQLSFFVNLLIKQHGSIVNSEILKQFIESFDRNHSSQLTDNDYKRLLILNCCKESIDLNKEEDY